MRDRMERLVLLPFSIGCVSESSVAIGVHQTKRAKTDTNLSASSLSLSHTQTYLHQVYLSHTHTHKIVFTFFFLFFFCSFESLQTWLFDLCFFVLEKEHKKKTRKAHQAQKVRKIRWSCLLFQSLTYPLGLIS